MSEEKLYYEIKKCFQILGIMEIEENFDEEKIKRCYRNLAKKYHPDQKGVGNEEKFKEIQNAYEVLMNEKNRRIYRKLKEKYENADEQENSQQEKVKNKQERTNKFKFTRRDGSKIEIRPIGRFLINNRYIYCYELLQYYKDITYSNRIYGKINLEELMNNFSYCDFCINTFLSKANIEKNVCGYSGYIGYIERANKNGRECYRIRDMKNEYDDIDVQIANMESDQQYNVGDSPFYDGVDIEKKGQILVKGKLLIQYMVFSDVDDIYSLVYAEKIDFKKIETDMKYKIALSKLLLAQRLKTKIKEGGYIGGLLYNCETDNYDIVIDDEIREFFTEKSKEKI